MKRNSKSENSVEKINRMSFDQCGFCKGRYCREHIPNNVIKKITDDFWKMPRLLKIYYVREVVEVKVVYDPTKYKSNRRNGTCIYRLRVGDQLIRVCKEKFLEVHGLRDKTAYYWLKDLDEKKFAEDLQQAIDLDPNFMISTTNDCDPNCEDGDIENMIGTQKIEKFKKIRTPNPNLWKRNICRMKRMKGESYQSVRRETLAKKRELGPPCTSPACYRDKIRYCSTFTQEERQQMFDKFWLEMDWDQKKEYALSLVRRVDVKRKRSLSSRRSSTIQYNLISPSTGKMCRVCRDMFLSTFSIGSHMLSRWISKSEMEIEKNTSSTQKIKTENNVDESMLECIKNESVAGGDDDLSQHVDGTMEIDDDDDDEDDADDEWINTETRPTIEHTAVIDSNPPAEEIDTEQNFLNRMLGNYYYDWRKQLRARREMGPTCTLPHSAARKSKQCIEISPYDRETLFVTFWRMSWQEKRRYLKDNTERIPINGGRSKRMAKYYYYLTNIDGKRTSVCKNMFLATLGIGMHMTRYWLCKKKVETHFAIQTEKSKWTHCLCKLKNARQCERITDVDQERISKEFTELTEDEKFLYLRKFVRRTKNKSFFVMLDGKYVQICRLLFSSCHRLTHKELNGYILSNHFKSLPEPDDIEPPKRKYRKRSNETKTLKEPVFSTSEEDDEDDDDEDEDDGFKYCDDSSSEADENKIVTRSDKVEVKYSPKFENENDVYEDEVDCTQPDTTIDEPMQSDVESNCSSNTTSKKDILTTDNGSGTENDDDPDFTDDDENDVGDVNASSGQNESGCACPRSSVNKCAMFKRRDRRRIHKKFWSMSWPEQSAFIRGLVDMSPIDHESIADHIYHLYHVRNRKKKVCQETFYSILNIDEDLLQKAIDTKESLLMDMGPKCESYQCLMGKFHFCNIFDDTHRQKVYENFSKLSDIKDREKFLRKFVKYRNNRYQFYLRYYNKILQVCRMTFMNTVGMNDEQFKFYMDYLQLGK